MDGYNVTLKGWLNTVKKKTARLSTRINAHLGLISLTRDEEFERHHETFKHIEKTIKSFIKNLSSFVEHLESFLLALQNTSENLSDFYRDKAYQRELDELKRKNKALACEHFHAFKRTVDRQVIAVASQLLQKFSGPHQLINKRSVKLLDYDTRAKEMESCHDTVKRNTIQDQYVIAKELYDRINRQLIDELPVFNQFALDIFKECILVLLESRRNLILSYTKQTASLLLTPLMMTYTASDVATSILMSCDQTKGSPSIPTVKHVNVINEILQNERKDSGHDTRQSSANDDEVSLRPHSATSQLSSEFEHMAMAAREICSTPLSQVSESHTGDGALRYDEPDGLKVAKESEGITTHSQDDEQADNVASNVDMSTITRSMVGNIESQPSKSETSTKDRRKKKKFQIYVVIWPFVATGPNQLSISCNQPLKLIKGCDECGNSDWSLVQDKRGQFGYVPSSYIKKKE